MDTNNFKKSVKELNHNLEDHYKEYETKNRSWIRDGLVNEDVYNNSPIKILWILKEPRDGENNTGGGWSIVENLREERSKGIKRDSSATYHPLTYVTYALLNNINSFEELNKSKIYSEYSNALNNIAYINIQKLPASAKSSDASIKKAFREHERILLNQIKTYKPDVIIFAAGKPTFNIFMKSVEQMNLNKDKCIIFAYHPAQTKISHSKYVNQILETVKHWKENN